MLMRVAEIIFTFDVDDAVIKVKDFFFHELKEGISLETRVFAAK